MNSSELLKVKNLRAGYGAPVVGPVSFSIEEGHIIGLGGANGSGKSTILKAITGAAKVFEGAVLKAPHALITHHWQRPEKPPELALLGRELFTLLGADKKKTSARIKPLLDMPLNLLSGGQFQLLQTAACLASPANLVLLDEPTNNLDGDAINELTTLLKNHDSHRSVILVSHEKLFLEENCERIIELP